MLSTVAPPHPGEVLKQKLLSGGQLSQRHLAQRLGLSPPRLNMLFSGRCLVTAEIALRVERVFGIPAQFWMSVRDEHELHLERQRLADELASLLPLEDQFVA